MQVHEWRDIAEQVSGLWGPNRKWARADEVYEYARPISFGAARSAVEQIYLDGRSTAPPPAEVLSIAHRQIEHGVTTEQTERFCAANGHQWGIVEDHTTHRVGICGRCRVEIETAPHLLTTLAEREAGEIYREDATTAMIAP